MTHQRADRFGGVVPPAGAVRDRLRAHRAKPRSLTARLADAYGRSFNVAVIGGIVISAANSGLETAVSPDYAIPAERVELLRWFVALAVSLLLALLGRLALAVGPVLVGATWQTWLLSTPVSRRELLTARFLAVLGVGGVAALAVAVLAVVAVRPSDVLTPLGPAVPVGVVLAALAVGVQSNPAGARLVRRVLDGFAVLCAVGFGVLALAGPAVPAFPFAPEPLTTSLIALVAAALAGWWAYTALGRLSRASLAAGTEFADATVTAVNWLDPALLSSTLAVRRARAVGRVRPARLRGGRTGGCCARNSSATGATRWACCCTPGWCRCRTSRRRRCPRT
ncbi:hypothetical protein KZQ38_30485 [Saccharothrix sp. SC076]|nr:hypothetical protein [Saccharothrix obliqua]